MAGAGSGYLKTAESTIGRRDGTPPERRQGAALVSDRDLGTRSLRPVIANLERDAALGRAPRSVRHARRPTGVLPGRERPVEGQVVEPALEDVHLLPERVRQDAH